MRFRPKGQTIPEAYLDMTPMIDVAFQLMAFFMFVLNFGEAIVDQAVKLPISELARPADKPPPQTLFLNMRRDGRLNHLGRIVEVDQMGDHLAQERQLIAMRNEALGTEDQTIVVIRADAQVPGGKVQELIQLCQQHRFEKFILRAKEQEG